MNPNTSLDETQKRAIWRALIGWLVAARPVAALIHAAASLPLSAAFPRKPAHVRIANLLHVDVHMHSHRCPVATSPNCTLTALPALQRWNASAPWVTCPNVTLYMGFVGEDARQRVLRSGYQVARVGRFSLSSTIDRLAKAVREEAYCAVLAWVADVVRRSPHRSQRPLRAPQSCSTSQIRSLQPTMGWRSAAWMPAGAQQRSLHTHTHNGNEAAAVSSSSALLWRPWPLQLCSE